MSLTGCAGAIGPVVLAPSPLEAEALSQALGTEAGVGDQVVVLVDPDAEQWAAARELDGAVVAVLERFERSTVAEALEQGADVVLPADSSLDAVREAAAKAAQARSDWSEAVPELTAREREVLDSIASGESVKETAASLAISAKTVENIQRRMFRRLGVRNRAQAVRRGLCLGLVPGPSAPGPGGQRRPRVVEG